MLGEFMAFRKPTADEHRLISELVRRAPIADHRRLLDTLLVREMSDGGMGSLELMHDLRLKGLTKFGRALAAMQFTDADGVQVIATLNADSSGIPFELDVWKTDFSPLLRIPKEFEPTEF